MSRKPKYDIVFKKKIISLIIKRYSIASVANEYSLSRSMLRKWHQLYLQHGTSGLTNSNRHYTPEFKFHVIKYMRNNSLSLSQTCFKFNIHSVSILNRWIVLYESQGMFGLKHENRGRTKSMAKKVKTNQTKEEDLLSENAYLKAENAYLKKLHALVQLEKENEKKRKSSKS
jgi:transposase